VKKRIFHACLLGTVLVCIAILFPQRAIGLAGFGEWESKYRFNDLAVLSWSHPADGCDVGTDCLRLERRGNSSRLFEGLDCTFGAINVPTDPRDSLILAHRQKDRSWIIYDLKAEKYVFETFGTEPNEAFDQAVNVWQSFGFEVPEFVNSSDHNEPYLFMTVPFLIRIDALGLPLLVIGFFWIFLLKGNKVYLSSAFLSLAAAASLWFWLLAVSS
jgi:hypothetical protein